MLYRREKREIIGLLVIRLVKREWLQVQHRKWQTIGLSRSKNQPSPHRLDARCAVIKGTSAIGKTDLPYLSATKSWHRATSNYSGPHKIMADREVENWCQDPFLCLI